MQDITRRAALQGTAAVAAVAVSVAAPLAVIPFRATAEDAEVFALIEERSYAIARVKTAEGHWYGAVQEALAWRPHLRDTKLLDMSREDRALLEDILSRPDLRRGGQSAIRGLRCEAR